MSLSTVDQSNLALALCRSPIPALRKLTLVESDKSIVLQGRVTSYYLKQLAQETLLPLLDGRQLLNRVQVVTELVAANV